MPVRCGRGSVPVTDPCACPPQAGSTTGSTSRSTTGDRHDPPVLVRLLRLDPDLPVPTYAHPGDAGADLVSRVDVTLEPGERILVLLQDVEAPPHWPIERVESHHGPVHVDEGDR